MLMFTDTNIKKFLRSKTGKTVKSNYKAILTEAQALLAERPEITPDTEIFYHELFKDKNISDSEQQTTIERVKEFINFANDTKGDNQMSENEDIMQPEIVTEAESTPVEPVEVVAPTTEIADNAPVEPVDTGKRGRPKTIEVKDKKGFNLQIEPAMYEQLKILADIYKCSMTDIITHSLAYFINEHKEDINDVLDVYRKVEERISRKGFLLI